MKYIITERQYGLVDEQLTMLGGPLSLQNAIKSKQYLNDKGIDDHTINSVMALATSVIPYVGPALSTVFQGVDALQYYQEGDKKMAYMMALFAAIPAVGGLAVKLGLSQWSKKALFEVGKKLSLGSKLSPAEAQVVSRVAQNKELILKGMEKLGKDATISAGKQVAKKELVKQSVKKGAGKIGGQMALYGGVGASYGKGYDFVNRNDLETMVKKEGFDWDNMKLLFGVKTKEDENLLGLAWKEGWRPGKLVPGKYQTVEYKKELASEM